MVVELDVIAQMEEARRTLAEIQSFVTERFDPVEESSRILGEEMARLKVDVARVLDIGKDNRREALLGTQEDEVLRVREGPYAGMTPFDLRVVRGIAHTQARQEYGPAWVATADAAYRDLADQLVKQPDVIYASGAAMERAAKKVMSVAEYDSHMRGVMRDVTVRAAMDSTTAAAGDELVPTLEAREIWMDVNLQTQIAPLIPTFPMPSSPFDMPTQLGDVNFYPGTENVVGASTALTTAKVTLTAYELTGAVPYSFTLEEDAVIAMLPEIRQTVVRNLAEVIDDMILNADTTGANGINSDGATITASSAGKGHWLIGYDGLIHLPLIDSSAVRNDHNAAVSDDMFNEIRAKLGKYGARPSELVWVMDVNTFIRSQSISNFRTMDKLGPNATLLTGMLGAVEGIPVVVSEQMKLADTDGKVTDAGNGTDTGRLLIVNRTQWRQGFRREITIDVDRDVQKRQTVIVMSLRHALTERSGTRSTATHTGLQYDITGV